MKNGWEYRTIQEWENMRIDFYINHKVITMEEGRQLNLINDLLNHVIRKGTVISDHHRYECNGFLNVIFSHLEKNNGK